MKPDKIILWLAESQFPDKKLPKIFDEVKACGVEVRFCPEDIGPHKKYFYVMQEYPEDLIITFDDDIVYYDFVIEKLYASYVEYPDCVSAMRVDKINFLPDGTIGGYYDSFDVCFKLPKGIKSFRNIATNGAGSLFPPHVIREEVFNIENIKKCCPIADDTWLKFMEVFSGTQVVSAWDEMCIPGWTIFGSQKFALWDDNGKGGENDKQIHAMLEAYSSWRAPDGRTFLEVVREE